MRTKPFGRTGVAISEIGVGTYNYRGGAALLRNAIAAGASFIDTAESYATEDVIREAIKGRQVFIATKVSPQNYRREDFRKSVDASLQKLGIETIDLLQLHYPNPEIPIQETMGAMAAAIAAGKVRFGGVSNFSVAQLQEAQKIQSIASNQVRYNLIDRTIEKDLLPYCQQNGVTVIAYSPLSKGLSRIIECDPTGAIAEIARATGKTAGQVALNWCLCHEGVVAIPGANSAQHMAENCAASDWRLSAEQLNALNTRIVFRHRNRLDAMLRKYLPPGIQSLGMRVLKGLPRGVRRRLT